MTQERLLGEFPCEPQLQSLLFHLCQITFCQNGIGGTSAFVVTHKVMAKTISPYSKYTKRMQVLIRQLDKAL